jgi:hypothetical protein
MEKVVVPSLNNPTRYITEFTDKGKKGHPITYQKRIGEATQNGK